MCLELLALRLDLMKQARQAMNFARPGPKSTKVLFPLSGTTLNYEGMEVTDCNWMQNEVQVEDLGLGTGFNKKLTRILATNEDEAGNYWKRKTAFTGIYFSQSITYFEIQMTS